MSVRFVHSLCITTNDIREHESSTNLALTAFLFKCNHDESIIRDPMSELVVELEL